MMTSHNKQGRAWGFTLTELLVVLGILVLALGIVLPSLIPLLSTSSMTQARAMISALLGSARGLAIEKQSYTLVHFQMSPDEKCWAAVFIYDNQQKNLDGSPNANYCKFVPLDGFAPRRMPGDVALIQVCPLLMPDGRHLIGVFDQPGLPAGERQPYWGFTTFNVVFGPDGALRQQVPDSKGLLTPPVIDDKALVFIGTVDQKIWEPHAFVLNNEGIRLMIAFSYREVKNLSADGYATAGSRANYLEQNGQFFCINPYTGQLLPSESKP